MIIRQKDLPEFSVKGDIESGSLIAKRIIQRDEHSKDISVVWVKFEGQHKKMACDASDRVYYIIGGEGQFQVGDDEPGRVTAGDFVFIPKGVPYMFDGHMTFLVMNGPAFIPGTDRFPE